LAAWSVTPWRNGRRKPILRWIGIGCLSLWALLFVTQVLTSELVPRIKVRWRAALTASDRATLERRFMLDAVGQVSSSTWEYTLLDTSRSNITGLVLHPSVEDTDDIDRGRLEISGNATPSDREAWLIHRTPIGRHPVIVDFLPGICLLTGVAGLSASLRCDDKDRGNCRAS